MAADEAEFVPPEQYAQWWLTAEYQWKVETGEIEPEVVEVPPAEPHPNEVATHMGEPDA